jgi:ribosome recycling factor
VKNGSPEDLGKRMEEDIDNLAKKYIAQSDELIKVKEKDIMTV